MAINEFLQPVTASLEKDQALEPGIKPIRRDGKRLASEVTDDTRMYDPSRIIPLSDEQLAAMGLRKNGLERHEAQTTEPTTIVCEPAVEGTETKVASAILFSSGIKNIEDAALDPAHPVGIQFRKFINEEGNQGKNSDDFFKMDYPEEFAALLALRQTSPPEPTPRKTPKTFPSLRPPKIPLPNRDALKAAVHKATELTIGFTRHLSQTTDRVFTTVPTGGIIPKMFIPRGWRQETEILPDVLEIHNRMKQTETPSFPTTSPTPRRQHSPYDNRVDLR